MISNWAPGVEGRASPKEHISIDSWYVRRVFGSILKFLLLHQLSGEGGVLAKGVAIYVELEVEIELEVEVVLLLDSNDDDDNDEEL